MAFDINDARLAAMLRGRRQVREVPFPGLEDDPEARIGVRVLLDSELDECREQAAKFVKERAKALQFDAITMLSIDAGLLDRENQRQIISKAFIKLEDDDDGKPQPFFASPTAVHKLDSVIVETLFNIYADHQRYVDPLSELSEAQVKEWIEAVKKSPKEADMYLAHYDAQTLARLVRSLVGLLSS